MSGMGIYGLSGSGIDVDSMVKMGMMTKQNEYDRMYKKEIRNEWEKEAYTNLYSEINTFNNSTLSKYKMSSTTNPQNVTSSDSSIFTATANADAAQMSHTVEVKNLASNAYMLTGKAGITRTGTADSIYLKDIIDTSTMSAGSSLDIYVSDGENEGPGSMTYELIVDIYQGLLYNWQIIHIWIKFHLEIY